MVEIDSVVGMSILQNVKKQFGVTGANFDLNYLSYFWINFQNSCGYHVANFQGCWIHVRSSSVRAPEPEKLAKTKSSLTYGTPCSIFIFLGATGHQICQYIVSAGTLLFGCYQATTTYGGARERREITLWTSEKLINNPRGKNAFYCFVSSSVFGPKWVLSQESFNVVFCCGWFEK